MLLGRPLIEWTIARALEAGLVGTVVVSTDSAEIAAVAREAGAEVPFLRPESLAQDQSMVGDAVIHCLDFLESQGECFHDVILLEPTSPLRSFGQIDRVIEHYWSLLRTADGVITVGQSRSNPAFMKQEVDGLLSRYDSDLNQTQRRQDNPEVLYPFGVAYVASVEVVRTVRSFYPDRLAGFRLDRFQEYEIDDLYDFLAVEAMMRHEWSDGRVGVCEEWVRSFNDRSS